MRCRSLPGNLSLHDPGANKEIRLAASNPLSLSTARLGARTTMEERDTGDLRSPDGLTTLRLTAAPHWLAVARRTNTTIWVETRGLA